MNRATTTVIVVLALAGCRAPRASFPRTVATSVGDSLLPEIRAKYTSLYPSRELTRIGFQNENWVIEQHATTGIVRARSLGIVMAYREDGECFWEARRVWQDSSGPNTWTPWYLGKVVATTEFGDHARGKLDCRAAQSDGPQDR